MGHLKLVVRGTIADTIEWRNIFYGDTTGDWNEDSISDWCGGLYATVTSSMSNQVKIYGVDVASFLIGHALTDPKGWGASTFVTIGIQGSVSGEALPPADCMLVLASTGVKHIMGRKFLPGIAEGQQANGLLGNDLKACLVAFSAQWVNPTSKPTTPDWTPEVWGPTHGFTTILAARGNDKVFHLDRRQVGRGI